MKPAKFRKERQCTQDWDNFFPREIPSYQNNGYKKPQREGDIEIKLLGFEPIWRKRKIKEAIVVKKLNTGLNGNEGSYQLSHIYDPIPSRIIREAKTE